MGIPLLGTLFDRTLEGVTRTVVFTLQTLPLMSVARLGRMLGGLCYWLDRRHRRVAMDGLQQAFSASLSPQQCRALALENFKRIGENYCCAVKTAAMSAEELTHHLEFEGLDPLAHLANTTPSKVIISAIGHFGNFEVYARLKGLPPGFRGATTYRGLKQQGLNRVMVRLRERSGCLFFERRSQAAELRGLLSQGRVMLGLLADQHAGDRGLPLPFFGRTCSTSAAPAVLALRYQAPLIVGICHRVRMGHWRVEFGPIIRTQDSTGTRSPESIMLEVNQAFERAIRQDPANWFWVHNRWKAIRRKPKTAPNSEPAKEV
jgi:lauroyl/myristoyl acyltransferase